MYPSLLRLVAVTACTPHCSRCTSTSRPHYAGPSTLIVSKATHQRGADSGFGKLFGCRKGIIVARGGMAEPLGDGMSDVRPRRQSDLTHLCGVLRSVGEDEFENFPLRVSQDESECNHNACRGRAYRVAGVTQSLRCHERPTRDRTSIYGRQHMAPTLRINPMLPKRKD